MFALAVLLARSVVRDGPLRAAGVLGADAVSVVFVLLIGLLFLAVSIYSAGWMRRELAHRGIKEKHLHYYYALVHAFVATMLVTVLADNLGVLWIAMEGTTITSAILVGFHGHRYGLEAAWKYIIVTTIGISFGLFGTVLIYAAAAQAQGGALRAMSYTAIVAVAHRLDPGIVRIGFIFVLIGYGTKVGLAPMHMWLPDAHSQAPSPVSALLSGALIKCALFGIIRFHTIARGACGPGLSGGLLLFFGLVSVVVATPFILAQRDFKRLLGYHSVEHVGIIALGLGFGGPIGTYAALLHVVNHGVTKALVFFVAGDAMSRYHSRYMHAIRGYARGRPAGRHAAPARRLLAGRGAALLHLRQRADGGPRGARGRPIRRRRALPPDGGHHLRRPHPPRRRRWRSAPPPRESIDRRRTLPMLAGMLLLGTMMLLLGVTIPPSLHVLLERATVIILG